MWDKVSWAWVPALENSTSAMRELTPSYLEGVWVVMVMIKESWHELEKAALQAVSRAGPLIQEALLVGTLQKVERMHPRLGDFKALEDAETKWEGQDQNKTQSLEWGVAHTFNLSIRRQRQADLREFKANLVYRGSSRTAGSTQRNPVSKEIMIIIMIKIMIIIVIIIILKLEKIL